jgi:formylglycine-generating enzyme required for sulfatase activity
VLEHLAFEAHRDQVEATGSANIDGDYLVAALLAATEDPDARPQRLAEYLNHRAGLLTEHGNGVYQFPHRTFQEYLAACHLTDDDFPDQLATLARHDPQRWREVVRLAAAKASRGSATNVWLLAETLCPRAVDGDPQDTALPLDMADAWGALLAGQILVENANLRQIAARDADKQVRIRDWQLALMRRRALPAVERALAGRNLDALGDPRPEVTTIDGMQFCHVPTGSFWMGDDEQGYAKPLHLVDLPAYWIGRYPVTTAQWRQYARESGHAAKAESSLNDDGNVPVASIDWEECRAFCAWLNARWAAHLPAGWQVCLPSEAEWEKAARGGLLVPEQARIAGVLDLTAVEIPQVGENPFPQRTRPWGDNADAERANLEVDIGTRSAVGAYPTGSSPCGGEEFLGNVWEWTRSLWGEKIFKPEFGYPYADRLHEREQPTAGSNILRVLRGCGWLTPRSIARCARRNGNHPRSGANILGFRVVLCYSAVRPLDTPGL